jgi:hypothetical protein
MTVRVGASGAMQFGADDASGSMDCFVVALLAMTVRRRW